MFVSSDNCSPDRDIVTSHESGVTLQHFITFQMMEERKLERDEEENDDEGQEGKRLICTDHNIYSTFILTFLVAHDILGLRSDIARVFFEEMREKESQSPTSQKPSKTILKS